MKKKTIAILSALGMGLGGILGYIFVFKKEMETTKQNAQMGLPKSTPNPVKVSVTATITPKVVKVSSDDAIKIIEEKEISDNGIPAHLKFLGKDPKTDFYKIGKEDSSWKYSVDPQSGDVFEAGSTINNKAFNIYEVVIGVTRESDKFNKIVGKIQKIIGVDFGKDDVKTCRVYETSFGNAVGVFTKNILLLTYMGTYMFETDENNDSIKLMDKNKEQISINLGKLWIRRDKDILKLSSQNAFSSNTLECEVKWDGKKMSITKSKFEDETADYYKKIDGLLKDRDIYSIKKLAGSLPYDASYASYFTQPIKVLNLAYEVAKLKFKNGDKKSAIEIMNFAMENYWSVWFLNRDMGLVQTSEIMKVCNKEDENKQNRLDIKSLIQMLNDYGYYLSEDGKNQKALDILLKVIELEPGRTVAYINLGDTEWKLNQKDNATKHYLKYIKLMGESSKEIPKRVYERTSGQKDYLNIGFEIMKNDNIGFMKMGTGDKEVVATLGKADEKNKITVWGADGKYHQSWIYKSKGIELDLIGDEGKQILNMIIIKAPCKYETARNIKIGSTREAVLVAYKEEVDTSEGTSKSSSVVVGSVFGGIIFGFTDDKVSNIFLGASTE